MTYRIPEGIVTLDINWVEKNIPKSVTKVICPSTLKKIGTCAFDAHRKIEEIIFNKELKVIDEFAFFGCNFKKIKIPKNVKNIKYCSFHNCSYLKEIILDDGVETICDYAFCGILMNIEKVIISNTVKEISEKAFFSGLYSITGEVIIGSKSPIASLSSYKLKNIFGPYANIIIKDLEKAPNLFDNIKKVSEEERNRLGLELFDEINKDDINIDKVQELLINGADTEIRDSNGNTGLMLMIKKGNNEVSMMYLLSGSDVNARNNLKETPLILASRSNNNDIASQLIDRNCIVNAITVLDESALSIAYDNGNIELVNRLENILNISSKERELEEVHRIRKRILGGK